MRWLWTAVAALAATFGPSGPASAADSGVTYSVYWFIEPDLELPDATWVTPGTSILSARLLPYSMFVLMGEVKDEKGAALLPAGTELIQPGSKATLGCTMQPSGLYMLSPRFYCLMDSDRDGSFDHFFRTNTPMKVLFTGQGTVPAKPTPIAPARFEPRDPHTAAFRPRLYLQYSWFASLVGELVFQVCLRKNDGGRSSCTSGMYSVKSKQFPVDTDVLGVRFRVEGKEENRVNVRMLSNFQPKPFFLAWAD